MLTFLIIWSLYELLSRRNQPSYLDIPVYSERYDKSVD